MLKCPENDMFYEQKPTQSLKLFYPFGSIALVITKETGDLFLFSEQGNMLEEVLGSSYFIFRIKRRHST